MSKSTNGLRKAGLASLAVTLTLGAGFASVGAANAITEFDFQRIGGADRYETSALVAEEFGTYDEAILANGEPGNYVDALAANYLAGDKDAPILLTRKDVTPQTVLDELEDEGVTNLTVVGGETVISAEQVDALEADGFTVTRVAGDDRFATNVEILEAGGAGNDTAIVATGFDFADALAGGPAVYKGAPVGLTSKDDIDDDVVAALKAAGASKAVVLGGTNVVDQAVLDELEDKGITPTRIAGSGRSETSTAFADYAIANLGFTDEGANIATGYTESYGADALAGGPLTGMQNRPMLITRDVDTVDNLVAWLNENNENLKEGIIFGGTAAVDAAAEAALEDAASTDEPSSATSLPELVSAKVVSTVTAAQASPTNPAGTTIAYTFDEADLQSPVASQFKAYEADGDVVGGVRVVTGTSGNTVNVRFNNLNTAALASAVTVATVDNGAVTQTDGSQNPEGDAALGTTSGGGSVTLPAGETVAPDLVSVTGFRQASNAGETAIDFTFDEAARTTATPNFAVHLLDGTVVTGTAPATGDNQVGGGTVPGGNGTTTITVIFDQPGDDTLITAAEVARGTVQAGSVAEQTNNESAPAVNDENELQSADVSNSGNTTGPDLVSVELRPASTTTANDQALFTFDQAVVAGTIGNFHLYKNDGSAVSGTGTATPNPSNNRQLLVTLNSTTATDNAVGGSVDAGAVVGGQRDEVGIANTATEDGQTAGKTAGPDLTGVALATRTDGFGNVVGVNATYTFDEVVASKTDGSFNLYLANGTDLGAPASCNIGPATGTTDDNTVVCAFNGPAGSEDRAMNATLGTVEAGAAVDAQSIGSPEGAEFTSGGTGTPAQ